MAFKTTKFNLLERAKLATVILQVAVLALASLVPVLLLQQQASAAQLTDRQVTLTDSRVAPVTSEYDFSFDFASTAVQSVIFEFCDAPLPLSTCTKPAGMRVEPSQAALDSHTNFPVNGTTFTEVAANSGDCDDVTADDATTTKYCINRTEATAGAGADATVDLSGIINSTAADTVYIRIYLYSDNAFATQVHQGTVAAAINETLTVNGRVQERLNFCVSAIDDAASMPATVAACTALTDNNIDLGVIDETSIARSPEDVTAEGADDDYGVLMLNTNASAGAIISYFPVADTGGTNETFSFRVDDATCVAAGSQPDETDQCFVDASNAGSGTTLASGTEGFGVQIPCIDTSQGSSSALGSVPDFYNNADDDTTNAANCEDTDAGQVYGWNESGTADTLTSSSTTVDNEIVKLRFGATAAPTTPSGEYTVTTVYIATVNF